MKKLLVTWCVLAAGFAVAWAWFFATGLCEDSPDGQHCRCWSERGHGCCWCMFTGGPHNPYN